MHLGAFHTYDMQSSTLYHHGQHYLYKAPLPGLL